MSYVVLARKWRPMSFRDLIGQEHVSRTLANAIARERVAHAFLFTGVRGVGKTTSARILAKALNCLAPQTSESGGVEPCLECAACREIAEGIDVDVREIDGASYTGVDEIRKLQESLPYRPTRDRYKIFIVDEVHMLSQNAWNALLKTLEEPPPHIKFILATTEVHKVPVTILSRVQRFDFKMIPSRLIAERIRFVLAREEIEADDRAVALVAREAAGSMRDALSLLDQVIAFSPKQLIGDDVSRVLGIAGYTALADIAEAVLRGEPGRALEGIAALANQACDLSVTARDLLGLLRDLVVAKLCREPDDLLDLSDDERRRVKALVAGFDANDLLRVQRGFATGFDDVARSPEPRAALEMLLARLALRPELLPLDDLLGRLGELEARLSGGKPPPSGGGSGRTSPPGGGPRTGSRPAAAPPARANDASPLTGRAASATSLATAPMTPAPVGVAGPVAVASPVAVAVAPLRTSPQPVAPAPLATAALPAPTLVPSALPAPTLVPAPQSTAPLPTPALVPAPRAAAPLPASTPVAAAPLPASVAAPVAAAPLPASVAAPVAAAPLPAPAPPLAAVPALAPRAVAAPPSPPPARTPATATPASTRTPAAAPPVAAARPAAPVAAAVPADVAPDAPEAALFAGWRRVLDVLGQSRADLVAILKHTVPLGISAEALTLGYEAGNVLEIPMRSPETGAALRDAAITCFGTEPKIVFQPVVGQLSTLAEADKRAREREKRAAVDRAERHPSVRDAVEILGARVKRIEIGEN